MYGWRGRLGVIVPRNNTVAEPEMSSVLPPGISLHGARVFPRGGATTREQVLSMVETLPYALEGLRGKAGAVGYACMTTSLMKPLGWHDTFAGATGGVPFLPAGETMVDALRFLGAHRIGVFSPYAHDVAALVPEWFGRFGIEVVHNVNVPFTPDEVGAQRCEDLYPRIRREFHGRDLDALAILATDLATFTAIDALETTLGLPVVSSNLALLWRMLASVGVCGTTCPGRLFRTGPAAAGPSRTAVPD